MCSTPVEINDLPYFCPLTVIHIGGGGLFALDLRQILFDRGISSVLVVVMFVSLILIRVCAQCLEVRELNPNCMFAENLRMWTVCHHGLEKMKETELSYFRSYFIKQTLSYIVI